MERSDTNCPDRRADPRLPRGAEALWFVLFAAICAGTVMRFVVRLDHGFWEDEIIAVTHAVQPLPQFFFEAVRDDIHPPLYFLQLHFWGWVSHADLWFVANSVTWGLIALLSLWAVQRRIGGNALALASTAYLAVLLAGLWMSQEVRPYAWLSVLFIWAYAFAVRSFATSQTGRFNQWVLFLLCLAIICSHAVGFYAVLFNGLFAFSLLVRRRAPRGDFLVTGANFVPVRDHASRVWLATYPRGDLPKGMPPDHLGSLTRISERRYSQLVVSLYE